MGRPKGFKMTEAHKAALKAGRERARLAKKVDVALDEMEKIITAIDTPVKEKRIMTPEHKAKIIEGRRLARERKIADGEPLRRTKVKKGSVKVSSDGKPFITITGKETDATDFYDYIRSAFRTLKRNNEVDSIIKEITDKVYWQNIGWILNTLSKYVVIEAA